MTRLAVALLGPLEVQVDGRPILGFRSDKARALLAYLAVESGRAHTREALAMLLWPDHARAQGLTYLRTTLANLRQALGDPPDHLLDVNRETLQLHPRAALTLDTVALAGLLAQPPTIDALQAAVALVRGPFLDGLASISAAFDEWAVLEREHARALHLLALQRLTALHLEAAHFERAEALAQRHLLLDPWDEGAHRARMVALALGGQRSAALAQYEHCRRLLQEELDVEPAHETTRLYEQIRRGAPPRSALPTAAPAPHAVPSLRAPRFVARERELAHLQRSLARALQGDGGVAFVAGGAGSGKSALLRAFTQQTLQEHTDVLLAGGACSIHSGHDVPYWPFREIVQMVCGEIEARRAGGSISDEHARRLWSAVPAVAQAIAEVAPALVGRFVAGEALLLGVEATLAHAAAAPPAWHGKLRARVNAGVPVSASADPLVLCEQMAAFLHHLARRRPLLLTLDDLQWADSHTVDLLDYLGTRLAGHRILIVGAYRPEEMLDGRSGERHPLARVVHELQRQIGDPGVNLDRADGRHFVEALIDSIPNRLDQGFRTTLFHHTEGHALFTVEILRGLLEEGALTQGADGVTTVTSPPQWDRIPPRIEAVIAERVERLPDSWREVLAAASVQGETFDAEVLARAARLDEMQVLWALGEPLSQRHQLVVPEARLRVGARGVRLARYRFAHSLYHRYLYGHLDPVRRVCLHERTAAALEAIRGDDGAEIASQLAWHCEQAELGDRAAHWHTRAGDYAMQMLACDQAIAHYERALAYLTSLPPSPARAEQEVALHMALAAPLNLLKGWGSPAAVGAAARAVEIGRSAPGGPRMVDTLLVLADERIGQGDTQTALALGNELLRLAGETADPIAPVAAHYVLGTASFITGELAQARDHLQRAIDLLTSHRLSMPVLATDMQVACCAWLAWVLWLMGYPEQSQQAVEDALARAHALDDTNTLGFALSVAGATLDSLRGDTEAARAHAEALAALFPGDGTAVYLRVATLILSLCRVGDEAHSEGMAEFQQAMAAWDASGTAAGRVVLKLGEAQALQQMGQMDQALKTLDETLHAIASSGMRLNEAELLRRKGELLLAMGADAADAEACLQQALTSARARQTRMWELRSAVSLGRLWQAQGKQGAAHALLAPLYAGFSEGFGTRDLQAARALLEDLDVRNADCSA